MRLVRKKELQEKIQILETKMSTREISIREELQKNKKQISQIGGPRTWEVGDTFSEGK